MDINNSPDLSRLKLKIVKTMPGHEGDAYVADLFIDGRLACIVHDDGGGGAPMYHQQWYKKKADQKAWCDLTQFVAGLGGHQILLSYGDDRVTPWDLECVVAELCERAEEEKTIRKWCRKDTVLRMPGAINQEYTIVSHPYDPSNDETILKQFPGAEIVNKRFASVSRRR